MTVKRCSVCKKNPADDYGGEFCYECKEKKRRERKRESCKERLIPKIYWQAELLHLSESLQATIKNLADGQGLFLWGTPGTGKTYAMAALAKDCIEKNLRFKRYTYDELCLRLRETFKQGGASEWNSEWDFIESLCSVQVLFIEDVGVTVSDGKSESDFSLRTLHIILDKRLENILPTFLTSNKSLESIEKSFDERIASRIFQACKIVKLVGKDRRKE